ncbi:diguanylate cyclase [Bacterioplanoides sp.]|uniref:diguanylate cyclase n=1 Tax=Bacterioplanoides sp. TaxID=2066072 RepID=UPI003B5BBD6B
MTDITAVPDEAFAASEGVSLLHRRVHQYIKGEPLHVLILGRNEATEALEGAITAAGYKVKMVDSISHLLAREEANTFAVIIDLDELSKKQHGWLIDMAESNKQWPVIALSSQDTLSLRATAVRMGGQAFVTTPVDVNQVLLELDALSERFERDPYHVLVVDDQQSVADFHSEILKKAGFVTHTIVTPLEQLMPYLQDNIPDLILLDLYMPDINGQELAGIIRQMDNLISVPIVFLSCEMSPQQQLKSLCTGADTFLTKPVRSADLLSAVESRIRRGRTVRNLVMRDPLTGLLNRRETMRRLEEERVRYCRYGHNMCLAMLDLDRFKSINDTYGHAVGDKVIKHFAMMLKSCLRENDIIGRWGGEEFVVALCETGPETAQQVLDRVAMKLKEQSPCAEFNYSFSGGLVCCDQGLSLEGMLDKADQALYKAKENGRNQVCIAALDN